MTLRPEDLLTITRHAKLAQVLHAVASLGVPDALLGGPRTAEELAPRVGAPAERVDRLLRAAASEGALDHGTGGYALNAFSRQLCAEGEGSVRSMLLGWALFRPGNIGMGHLDVAVRRGLSGVEAACGQTLHHYLDSHAEEAQRYRTAMESTVESFSAGARAYDFSRFGTVVDVGGGLGGLLVAVMREHPVARGILVDLPRVVEAAAAHLAQHPEGPRIEVVAGDLFHDLPADADAYLYSTVLRCFEDDECLAALQACAQAVRPGGQVVLVEMVMAEGVPPSPTGLADVYAMAVYGGKDRTRTQWSDLLGAAGFGPPTFHPVEDGPFSVVAATVG